MTMRKYVLFICAALLSICSTQCRSIDRNRQNNGENLYAKIDSNLSQNNDNKLYSKSTLIIFYDADIGKSYLLKAIKACHAKILYQYNNFNGMAIAIPMEKKLEESIHYFEKVKGVVSVNRDMIYKLDNVER